MQTIRYVLVQTSLDSDSAARLQLALENLPRSARSAYAPRPGAWGIVARDLLPRELGPWEEALREAGIETTAIPQDHLPPLPPTRVYRRGGWDEQVLSLFDGTQRQVIEWQQVSVFAAGIVDLGPALSASDPTPPGAARSVPVWASRPSAERPRGVSAGPPRHQRRWIDFVHGRRGVRHTVEIDGTYPSLLDELGGICTGDVDQDFALLVREFASHLAAAHLNLGAQQATAGLATVADYPSASAYHEEIVWLMCRRGLHG